MDFLNEILKDISDTKYLKAINKIHTIKDLDFVILEIINFNKELPINSLEPLIKIVLGKILSFNGEIDTNKTKILYDKLKKENNNTIELLDCFIRVYDEHKKIKIMYLSLAYQFLKCYNKQFPSLNVFLVKEKLSSSDIEEINRIITEDIHTYFQSIFDLNFNNKQFFKRITDCRNEITQAINTDEMVKRMLQLTKILGIKTLFKLKLPIISVKEFCEKDYNNRVKYFRLFYIKTYSIFKLYNKHYNQMIDLENKLSLIIKIDPLDYIDRLDDSSSSFILSDDLLNVNLDLDDLYDDNDIFDFDNSSDNRDTPFLPLNENLTQNDDTNKPDYDEDNESDIFDLFVKN